MFLHVIKTIGSYCVLGLIVLGLWAINLHKPLKTLTIQMTNTTTRLFFVGVTNPLNTAKVLSPFDGVVQLASVPYGSEVKKGQLLFVIKATQQENDFRSAVEEYIKTKAAYQTALFSFQGNDQLFKLGLISQLAFNSSQDALKTNALAVWGSEQRVKKVLLNTGIDFSELQSLTLDNISKMQPLLRRAVEGIKVMSPAEGVLLFPSKTLGIQTSSTEGEVGPVRVGSTIKNAQILAVVANMKGLQLEITVNEVNFHEVVPGKKVTIKGAAFPNIVLDGFITSINHQANGTDFNSAATYTAYVRVPHLTTEQQKRVQVGMSAEITLTKLGKPMIMIPIKALTQKMGTYWVNILSDDKQTIQEVPVITGITDESSVQIEQGLKVGDTLVLPD